MNLYQICSTNLSSATAMLYLIMLAMLQTPQPSERLVLASNTCHQMLSDSLAFKDYYGFYRIQTEGYVGKLQIFYKDEALYGLVEGYPPARLVAKELDEFEEPNYQIKVSFERKDGIIIGLKLVVRHLTITGEKLP